MIYQVCDLTFESELSFPQLRLASEGKPDCTFLFHPDTHPQQESWQWTRAERCPNGRPWLSFAHEDAAHLLRFHDVADFRIDFTTDRITAWSRSGVSAEVVANLFLDKVIPLYLSRRRLVLHASAVATPAGCVAFLGPSGQGKSTLAAWMETLGCSLLTDDYLVLREEPAGLFVVPSYPKLSLRDDSAAALTSQRAAGLVPAGLVPAGQVRRAPLLGGFVLGPAAEVSLSPLSRRDAFIELLRNAFQIETGNREAQESRFSNMVRVASRAPLFRFSYPREFALLPNVGRRLLEWTERG